MNARSLLTIALVLATAACSGDDSSTTDASVDAAKDATGKEASVIDSGPADATVSDAPAGPVIDPMCNPGDAGVADAMADAMADANTDAMADADTDAMADADTDAAADAGVIDGGGTDAAADAGGGGSGGACIAIDDAGIQCNPITNFPCNTAAGEACDFSQSGFQCYSPPPPNTADLCQSCDVTTEAGPACLPGSTCLPTANGDECARYCCDDSDCPTGHCDKTTFQSDPLGFCVK